MKEAFLGAARAYTIGEFNEYMMKLDKIDEGIRTYLEETGFSKWARMFSKNKRYSSMTSNTAESINAPNKAAKQLPIAPLLECLRNLTQKRFWENKNEALATKTKVLEKTNNIVTDNYILSMKMK
ncbi:hypothetical protein TorRG33x02_305660, partial [Trema orientale]